MGTTVTPSSSAISRALRVSNSCWTKITRALSRLDSLQQIIAQTDTDVRDRLQNADTTFLIYHPALSSSAISRALRVSNSCWTKIVIADRIAVFVNQVFNHIGYYGCNCFSCTCSKFLFKKAADLNIPTSS